MVGSYGIFAMFPKLWWGEKMPYGYIQPRGILDGVMAFEIEIKSLLGSKESADALHEQLARLPGFRKLGSNSQLNHYLEGGSSSALLVAMNGRFSEEKQKRLETMLSRAKNLSIRSREYKSGEAPKKVTLIIKTTIDDTTSANGTAREEFEEEPSRFNLGQRLNLDDLDEILLGAGFTYQAKWSRERKEYKVNDITIAIDKNAGYGYLAEFEKIISDASRADATKGRLRSFMRKLGVEELDHARLERMFAHYNAHWPEYYGTDKVFTVL